jgi:hypothetical protein
MNCFPCKKGTKYPESTFFNNNAPGIYQFINELQRNYFMKTRFLIILIAMLLLSACSQATQTGNPVWVDKLIQQFESQPLGNPPQSIWRYDYNGQVVYYIPAQCCDQYSTLLDAQGNVLCAPDGGFIGWGDGKCPDFFKQRSSEQLVWQDDRTR